MFSIVSVPMQAGAGIGLPWWVWLIILIIAFIIMAMLAPKKPEPVAKVPEAVRTMAVDVAEDLTRIEGIGPKIKAGMHQHGVSTFAKMAAMDVEALRDILRDIGIAADPTTWPGQARLAAEGKWEELQKLQDELQGGRAA
jgi:helix-hairpin-helix protein